MIDTEDHPRLRRYFQLARNVSKHSDHQVKVGCVITKGNHPISVGFNTIKFNRLYINPWHKSIHAEVSAIRTSGKEFIRNSTVYVYRETKKGIPALARPCEDCLQRLRDFGVRKIYYSTDIYPYYILETLN